LASGPRNVATGSGDAGSHPIQYKDVAARAFSV